MNLKSPISEFCELKGVPENIRDAFSAYMRSVYSQRFLLRGDTDTVRLLVNRLTQEQLEQGWKDFVSDLKKYLME